MKRFRLAAGVMLIALGACTQQVTKHPLPYSGSKSDGTVTLAYEYGLFEQPVVDWDGAIAVAENRCKAWGYKGAESFGATQTDCVHTNGYGNCLRWRVASLYQCIDKIRK